MEQHDSVGNGVPM